MKFSRDDIPYKTICIVVTVLIVIGVVVAGVVLGIGLPRGGRDRDHEPRSPTSTAESPASMAESPTSTAESPASTAESLTSNPPTFTVESSAVKAYSFTDDDRLSTNIEFSIQAHNRNSKMALMGVLSGDVHVQIGKLDHNLADVNLKRITMDSGENKVYSMKAEGDKVELRRNVAEKMRADAAVTGEVLVNLSMSGRFLYVGDADNVLSWEVTCKDVVVDFSNSADRVQKVECGVEVRVLSRDSFDR